MIKIFRTQSVLKELIPEALATLSDTLLQNLCVTDVQCKKGKYDADVYLDKMMFTPEEQSTILSRLRKVSKHLETHCATAEGWYRCPSFHFRFDEQLEKQNHLDALFDKMEKELKRATMNEARLKALLHDAGVELYDTETTMESGRKIYRIFITCKEGVTLEMCSKVTHILSPILDLEPPISDQYYLEVSSPGLERKLTKPSHYARSIGEMVKLKTFEKESLEGKLLDVFDTGIRLELPEETKEIAFSEISKARTFVVW